MTQSYGGESWHLANGRDSSSRDDGATARSTRSLEPDALSVLVRLCRWFVARVGALLVDVLRLSRSSPLPHTVPLPLPAACPDTAEVRTAVHEAGHAIAAWYCTAVIEVVSVSIDFPPEDYRDGLVLHRVRADAAWCRLVISMSGIAAEVFYFRKFHSGEARNDLAGARQLAECVESPPPEWLAEDGSAPPFARMFKEPLTPEVESLLARAYCTARALVASRMQEHAALVSALLHWRRLDGTEITRVLGNRLNEHLVGLIEPRFVGLGIR